MTQPLPPSGAPLTDREVQILALVADSLTTLQIAAQTGLARGTVKTHIKRLRAKLDAATAAGAVSRGYLSGLLAVPASGGLATVPAGALELLEACARAAASGSNPAAARFARLALDALDGVGRVAA